MGLGLRREVLVGLRVDAWAKSSASEGSLGWDNVDAVAGVEKPWNWDVRSLYCFCRPGRASSIEAAFL